MKRVTTKIRGCFTGENNSMKCHSATYSQTGALSPKHLRYRGFALAWTAIVFTVLMLIVGLSLDVAKLLYNVHELQNATDSAALAGAQIVKSGSPDDTRQFTHDLGLANTAEHLVVTLRMTEQPLLIPYPTDWDDPVQVTAYEAAMAPLDIVLGRWVTYNHTFVPTLDAPNAVQAVARRNAALGITEPALRALSLIFGPIVEVDTADASTLAVGWCYNSGGAGLICLSDPVPGGHPGLQIGGNAFLDVDDGGIHVNSTDYEGNLKAGTWIQNGAEIDAGFINTVGGIDPPPDDSTWDGIFQDSGSNGFSVSDMTSFPKPEHIEDPLAANMVDDPLVEYNHLIPSLIGSPDIPPVTHTIEGTQIPTDRALDFSCSLEPGYYPMGLKIPNGVEITLVPTTGTNLGLGTIFVFGGGPGNSGSLGSGITMTGGRLEGYGVTCYVTKNIYNGVCGVIDINGGAVDLFSPGDWKNEQEQTLQTDPIYLDRVNGRNGVAIWQDPTMVDSNGDTPDVKLTGNGDFFIGGTVYFPDPIHAFLRGDLGDTGNQILCGSVKLEGGAIITVAYDKRNQGFSSNVCLVK